MAVGIFSARVGEGQIRVVGLAGPGATMPRNAVLEKILRAKDLVPAADNKARFAGWAAEPTKRKMRRAVSTDGALSGPPAVVRTGVTAARSPPDEERREAARSRRLTRTPAPPEPWKARTSKHWCESLQAAKSELATCDRNRERAARCNAVSLWRLFSVGAVSLHNADITERLEAQLHDLNDVRARFAERVRAETDKTDHILNAATKRATVLANEKRALVSEVERLGLIEKKRDEMAPFFVGNEMTPATEHSKQAGRHRYGWAKREKIKAGGEWKFVRNTRPQGGYCASQNQEGYALRRSHVGLTPYSFSFALRRCSSQPHTRTERRYIQTG